MEGRARSPFLAGRKMDVLEDLARPAHFFGTLVARDCSSRSSHVIWKTLTSRGHDSLGQTPCLKKADTSKVSYRSQSAFAAEFLGGMIW